MYMKRVKDMLLSKPSYKLSNNKKLKLCHKGFEKEKEKKDIVI